MDLHLEASLDPKTINEKCTIQTLIFLYSFLYSFQSYSYFQSSLSSSSYFLSSPRSSSSQFAFHPFSIHFSLLHSSFPIFASFYSTFSLSSRFLDLLEVSLLINKQTGGSPSLFTSLPFSSSSSLPFVY